MKTIVLPLSAAMMCLVFLTPTVWGQALTPNANLSTIGLIPVPGWTTAAGAFDLASFDPLNRIMYFADGTNHAITSVDTTTNTFISSITPPGCTQNQCPSGIQAVPDLQKLVGTNRQPTDWIYDLRSPGAPPVALTVPSGTDELAYDRAHQTLYVPNTNPPFFRTGIDMAGAHTHTLL